MKVKPVYKTIQSITGYKTSDDRVFEKLETAQEHQQYLNYKDEFYNVFDKVFDDYLEGYCKDELPFNEKYLKETLMFLVSNINLESFILELQRLQGIYNNKK
jgi:hypothetical protein